LQNFSALLRVVQKGRLASLFGFSDTGFKLK
jgi:hypothetical protein